MNSILKRSTDVRDPLFSDDGLLTMVFAFVFICLFSFLIILFPSSASAEPLTPGSVVTTSDHRAPPPALATSSLHTLPMSPSPKTPLASGRVQRTAGSAVILSYLLGVRPMQPVLYKNKASTLKNFKPEEQKIVDASREKKSDPSDLAVMTLQHHWRWSR